MENFGFFINFQDNHLSNRGVQPTSVLASLKKNELLITWNKLVGVEEGNKHRFPRLK